MTEPLSPDRVAALRVLYLALFWPTPWLSAEEILNYGWHYGLRARTAEEVETILWPMRGDSIAVRWEDETPARSGRFMFQVTAEGWGQLVNHLLLAVPERRRWWPRRRRRRRGR